MLLMLQQHLGKKCRTQKPLFKTNCRLEKSGFNMTSNPMAEFNGWKNERCNG